MAGDGDSITKDYQFQIHTSIAYGCGGGDVHLDYRQPIDGLGVPDTKTQDVVYNFRNGSYANPDYLQGRVLTIPCFIKSASPGAALNALDALSADWQPLAESTELAFQLPGWGLKKVNGRPRGLKADIGLLRSGVIHVLLRFDAVTNPTIIDL